MVCMDGCRSKLIKNVRPLGCCHWQCLPTTRSNPVAHTRQVHIAKGLISADPEAISLTDSVQFLFCKIRLVYQQWLE